MEEVKNLECVQMYRKGVKAYEEGQLSNAYNYLQIACSSLMFEITMSTDKKKIEYLSKRLMLSRAILKEIKLVNKEFSI